MLTYRAELDGLRAIAVLSVVLYHAGFGWIPGGYVGVDIFFVLSGFLITSILMREIESGKFSYAGFYERRIRRLLPPLIPVLMLSGATAFFLFESDQFESVSKSLYSTLALSANWYFLSTVGYFDGPGEMTPLLHMWSLSIEEQFYLVFPALLVLVIRRRKDSLSVVCLSLLLVSFMIAAYYIYSGQQDKAFYSSHARFWELLVGALLASLQSRIHPSKRVADVLEVGGLALMLAGVFFYTSETLFPGLTALAPVLGTAMIIAANGVGRFVSPFLKVKPVVWVGLISYGLYLWHWPVLVFIKYLYPLANVYIVTMAVAISVALSAITYYWVEGPVRRKRIIRERKAVFAFGVTAVATMFAVAVVGFNSSVGQWRITIEQRVKEVLYDGKRVDALSAIEKEKKYYLTNLNLNYHGGIGLFNLEKHRNYTCSFDVKNTQEKVLDCLAAQSKGTNVLVVGDSIGRDTTWALRRAYPEVNFIMLHHSGCPPAEIHYKNKNATCFPGLESTLKKLADRVKVRGVILSFRYRPKHWWHIKNSIPWMKSLSGNVLLLGVSPMFSNPLDKYIRSLPENVRIPAVIEKSDSAMVGWSYDGLASEARFLAQKYQIRFADVSRFYCARSVCRLWLDDSYQKPLYWDNQHLTDPGISALASYLANHSEVNEAIFTANN